MTGSGGPEEWGTFAAPLFLSLRVAFCATVLAVVVGLPVAWRLGCGPNFRGRALVDVLLTLPLVLPPTVVGYVLLLILGRGTAFGTWLQDTVHLRLLLTWPAAALAACVMAFPLLVRTATAAFATVDTEVQEAARTMGATEWRVFLQVVLPMAYQGIFAGVGLAFARALGEFGATLMVAGNIPGETQTLPLALYDAVQAGDDARALRFALLLLFVSLSLVALSGAWSGRIARTRGERG